MPLPAADVPPLDGGGADRACRPACRRGTGTASGNASIQQLPVTAWRRRRKWRTGTVGAATIRAGGTLAAGNGIGTLHVAAILRGVGAIYSETCLRRAMRQYQRFVSLSAY